MKQPNVIAHMGWAGLWMGTLIGGVYGILFIIGLGVFGDFGYGSIGMGELLGEWIIGAMLGGLFGGGFGLPMGLFIGIVLAVAVRRYPMPLRADDLQSLKKIGQYACMVAVLGAFAVILMQSAQMFILDVWTITLVVLPLCIAFFASIRAMNRYIQKLDTFMGGKSKAKREAI